MMNVLKAILQWTWLVASNLVLVPLGFIAVAVGIPFRVKDLSVSDGRSIVNLPRWLWLFGNDHDGLTGDKRGKWATLAPFGTDVNNPFNMWWWAAVRNPVNNKRELSLWSAPVTGSKITYTGKFHVRDHPGEGGFQFVVTENAGRCWYGLYWVHEWSATRAFVIRIGFKVEPDHAGTVGESKGFTTKINLFKRIA